MYKILLAFVSLQFYQTIFYMELLEGIFTRRSIRKYRNKKLSDQQVRILLKAGMQAPSAMNCQPWHFMVIKDREKLKKIMDIHAYAQMLKEAAIAILVMIDTKLEHDTGYGIVDCGAATQNILLAAHGIGLGAVWIGIHPREARKKALKELFHLPGHVQPYALVSVGYPAEVKPIVDRFTYEKVHYDEWNQR
jgi:nitroreductase